MRGRRCVQMFLALTRGRQAEKVPRVHEDGCSHGQLTSAGGVLGYPWAETPPDVGSWGSGGVGAAAPW